MRGTCIATMLLSLSVFSSGCAGESLSAGPASGSDPAPGVPVSAPASVVIQGFVHASDGTLLGGTTVCVAQESAASPAACTIGTRDGAFAIEAPTNASITLTFQKGGYLPALRPIATEASPIALPDSENTLWPVVVPQTFLGTNVVPGAGQVEFQVLGSGSQPPPAVSVTIAGMGVESPSPVYIKGTGGGGGTLGGFANLPAGLYVVRFGGGSVTCTPNGLYGYPMTVYQDPSSGVAAVVVPVAAGTVTAPVGAVCTPK